MPPLDSIKTRSPRLAFEVEGSSRSLAISCMSKYARSLASPPQALRSGERSQRIGFRRSRASDLDSEPWRETSAPKALSYLLKSCSFSMDLPLPFRGLRLNSLEIPGSAPTTPAGAEPRLARVRLRLMCGLARVAARRPAPRPKTTELKGAGRTFNVYEAIETTATDPGTAPPIEFTRLMVWILDMDCWPRFNLHETALYPRIVAFA